MISILLRSIIKDLSSVTAQLIDLTNNAVYFRWKDKQQNTFKASETSKLRLCSAPVLDTLKTAINTFLMLMPLISA